MEGALYKLLLRYKIYNGNPYNIAVYCNVKMGICAHIATRREQINFITLKIHLMENVFHKIYFNIIKKSDCLYNSFIIFLYIFIICML